MQTGKELIALTSENVSFQYTYDVKYYFHVCKNNFYVCGYNFHVCGNNFHICIVKPDGFFSRQV